MDKALGEQARQSYVRKLRSLSYSKYLRSGHVWSLRRETFRLADHRCQHCGLQGWTHDSPDGVRLQLHHVHYDSLGCEVPGEDTQAVCGPCHERVSPVPSKAAVKRLEALGNTRGVRLPALPANKYEYLQTLAWLKALPPLSFMGTEFERKRYECFWELVELRGLVVPESWGPRQPVGLSSDASA